MASLDGVYVHSSKTQHKNSVSMILRGSLMSQMHYAYLYLFYPIPRHLARGFGKKDDENDKKCGIEAL